MKFTGLGPLFIYCLLQKEPERKPFCDPSIMAVL
jgi:hypothetical protein